MARLSLTQHDVVRPRGLVLLLHGGKPHSSQPVDGRSASWRRMAAIQRALDVGLREAGVHDVGTWLLRYRVRGWNDGAPVADAREALALAHSTHPGVPIVLLGHSMGARTAVHVADDASVRGVVGLAPWWSDEDPVRTLRGRSLYAAHGRTDKITSARMTQAYLQRAEPWAESIDFVDMGRVGHYLLRRIAAWNAFATSRCAAALNL